MPISFTCPHCGKQTEVAEKFAGQSGPCGSCGQTITVPTMFSPAAAPPAAAVPTGAGAGATLLIVGVVAVVVLFVCGGVLVALLLPAVQAAREAARRTQCTNNMRQIALAFHNYHDTYGTFPPAYIADENGKPMHSWRTLILPFLEQQGVHAQYDFSQPWDSPANLAATSTPIPAYTCPDSTSVTSTETHYMVIIGPGTVFNGSTAANIASITDGTSNTILVVEVNGTGVNWADPTDLSAATITFPASNGGPGNAGSLHPGGLNVAMCDGSVRFVSNSIGQQVFQQMITASGGEVLPPQF